MSDSFIDQFLTHPRIQRIRLRFTVGALCSLGAAIWAAASSFAGFTARLDQSDAMFEQARADHERILQLAQEVHDIHTFLGLPEPRRR